MAATTPLYFNILDLRSFEPDKATLLRNLCVVMAIAWLVKAFEAKASPARAVRYALGDPLLASVLFLAATTVIAAAASIAPVESVIGSFERSEGIVTLGCYFFVALALAANLRSVREVERLVTVMVLASLPMALYALVQAAGLDPLRWAIHGNRAGSTQGNPVFLGAVLCMVVPITLTRLATSIDRVRAKGVQFPGNQGRRVAAIGALLVALQLGTLALFLWIGAAANSLWWAAQPVLGLFLVLAFLSTALPTSRELNVGAAAGYVVVLGIQIAALVVSASRGPWLGLVVGCGVVAFGAAARSPGRSARLALVAAPILAVSALVAANYVGRSSRPGSTPFLRPLTQLVHGGASGEIRLLIWRGSLELIARHPAATLGGDPLGHLRPFVGYGPETFRDAYGQVYQPKLDLLQPGAVPDRAHNALLDTLVSTGVLGLIGYLLVFHMLFAVALERLGLVAATSVRRVRVLICLTGIVGLLCYLVYSAWRARPPPAERESVCPGATLGLLGSAVAYFVETQFGFGVVTTLCYVWIVVGVMAALGRVHRRPAVSVVPRVRWFALYAAASVAVIAVLVSAGTTGGATTLLLTSGFVWLAAALVACALGETQSAGGRRRGDWPRWRIGFVAVLAAGGGAAVLVNSAPIAADVHARTAVVSEAAADHAGSIAEYQKALRLEPYEDVYYRALARDLIELAVGASTTGASERAPRDTAEAVAMPARRLARLSRDQLLGTAAILLWRARSLEPSNPNIDTGLARLYSVWAKDADGARRVGLLERSSAWYRRAVKLAPHAVALRLELGVNQIAGHEYPAAIATLTSAIALEPAREVTVARELRGDARLGIGEVDYALADYRRALHDNPDALFDDNLASRVRVVGREGRLDTLIATFRAAIRNEPPEKRWLTEKTLGFLYAQIGARDLARHEFAAARATAPAALRPRIDELLHRLRRPS